MTVPNCQMKGCHALIVGLLHGLPGEKGRNLLKKSLFLFQESKMTSLLQDWNS